MSSKIRSVRLLIAAAVLLVATRLALAIFPFRSVLAIHKRLTDHALLSARRSSSTGEDAVCRAVRRASRRIPGLAHCLTTALVAKLMLARTGSASDLRIGVAKDPQGCLTAHAWLEADGQPIFGVSESELEHYHLLPHLDRV